MRKLDSTLDFETGTVPPEVLYGVDFASPEDEKRTYETLEADYERGDTFAHALVVSWSRATTASAELTAAAEKLAGELARGAGLKPEVMTGETRQRMEASLLLRAMNAPELTEVRAQMREGNAAFREAYRAWAAQAFKELAEAQRPILSARTKDLPSIVRFASDSLLLAAISAFARVGEWEAREGFARAWSQELRGLQITVGLPDRFLAERMWQGLARGGPRMVKAHYALWARYYEEVGEHENQNPADVRFVTISVPQFCADIGLKKHHKGGFRRVQKQQALQLLEAMASLELDATYRPPGSNVEQVLSGPLWLRDTVAKQRTVREREMHDLMGQARVEAPDEWEPVAFTYAPGAWFRNGVWRKYNHAIGKIGSGLLKLENDEDQWAILIGGYLGTQIRVGHYKPLRRRISTILRRTGLAETKSAEVRNAQFSEKFYRALEKLIEVGAITNWALEGTVYPEPDMDDPESLAEYAAQPLETPDDWRSQIITFYFPFQGDARRLTEAKSRAIEKSRKSRSKSAATKSKKSAKSQNTKKNPSTKSGQLALPESED